MDERAPGITGTVVVFQDRHWAGARWLGSFRVTIDRRPAGTVPVSSELTMEVTSGRHSVRVRQWWYRSPSLDIDVPGGGTIRLRADIARTAGAVQRMARMILRPSHSLTLTLT